MLRTFNCGIGAVLVCSSENKNVVLELLKSENENPVVIGVLKPYEGNFLRIICKISYFKLIDFFFFQTRLIG